MNHDYDIVQQPFDLAFFSVSAIRAALVNTSWIFIFSNAEHSITSCADTCVPTFLPSSKLKYFFRKKNFEFQRSQDQVVRVPGPSGSDRTILTLGSVRSTDQIELEFLNRTGPGPFSTDRPFFDGPLDQSGLWIPDRINKSNKWVEMSHLSALLIKL